MILLNKFFWDRRGGYASIFLVLYFMLCFSWLVSEYFRMIGIREEAEYLIQRGINVAMEDMLRDPLRWDFISSLDTGKVWTALDRYLRSECNLDAQYRRLGTDGRIAWQLQITSRIATDDMPDLYVSVEGKVVTRSIVNLFSGDVVLPFSVRSRTVRLD